MRYSDGLSHEDMYPPMQPWPSDLFSTQCLGIQDCHSRGSRVNTYGLRLELPGATSSGALCMEKYQPLPWTSRVNCHQLPLVGWPSAGSEERRCSGKREAWPPRKNCSLCLSFLISAWGWGFGPPFSPRNVLGSSRGASGWRANPLPWLLD